MSARELLEFRYFLHHNQGAGLESAPLAALLRNALALRARLPGEFEAFDTWLVEVATTRGWPARASAVRAAAGGPLADSLRRRAMRGGRPVHPEVGRTRIAPWTFIVIS